MSICPVCQQPELEPPEEFFTLSGKPSKVSREFVRAWLHASRTILEYHKRPLGGPIRVRLVSKSRMSKVQVGDQAGEKAAGTWSVSKRTMKLRRGQGRESMATVILHEMVHACCGDFGESNEHCTSTLTAKLKPAVAALAQVLLDGTYQRAAFLAHTKLSYQVDEDRYNDDQFDRVGLDDKYKEKAS